MTGFVRFVSIIDTQINGVSAGCADEQNIFLGRTIESNEIGPIILSGSTNGPRLYWLNKDEGEFFDNMDAVEYLATDCNCDYEWVLSESKEPAPNAVPVDKDEKTFFYGRMVYKKIMRVGRIESGSQEIPMSIGTKVFSRSKGYEMLVCKPKKCYENLRSGPCDEL